MEKNTTASKIGVTCGFMSAIVALIAGIAYIATKSK